MWRRDRVGRCSFVLPSGTVIGGDGSLRSLSACDLSEVRREVCGPRVAAGVGAALAELAVGNSRFMLALAVVCSAPLPRF